MLPHAIAMLTAEWENGMTIECSILCPIRNGLKFRIPEFLSDNFRILPQCFQFYAIDEKLTNYERVSLTEFTLTRRDEQDDDCVPGSCIYLLTCDCAGFVQVLNRLLHQYQRYIEVRLNHDETEWNEVLTGRIRDNSFSKNLSEWQNKMRGTEDYREPLMPVEIAVSLDLPSLWKSFLFSSWDDFLSDYWNRNGLSGHPITYVNVSAIYIGSEFCPQLLPEKGMLGQLLNRCSEFERKPVVCFSTMPEHLISHIRDAVYILAEYAEEKQEPLEIVLNDIGMAAMLREMETSGEIPQGCFSVTAGVLLNKRRKDPRTRFCLSGKQSDPASSAVNASFYRDYLQKRYGFTGYTYETAENLPEITGSGNVLRLPLYQTNTAGFCTLYASCRTGERGKQKAVDRCPCYCEHAAFFYPDELKMIGRWNSIFGCSLRELDDSRLLNALIRDGIGRFVIRM